MQKKLKRILRYPYPVAIGFLPFNILLIPPIPSVTSRERPLDLPDSIRRTFRSFSSIGDVRPCLPLRVLQVPTFLRSSCSIGVRWSRYAQSTPNCPRHPAEAQPGSAPKIPPISCDSELNRLGNHGQSIRCGELSIAEVRGGIQAGMVVEQWSLADGVLRCRQLQQRRQRGLRA